MPITDLAGALLDKLRAAAGQGAVQGNNDSWEHLD
jgi:hypothetical protein